MDPLVEKDLVLKAMRGVFQDQGFLEVTTPVRRLTSSVPFPRVAVGVEGYLRDSMEMSLRYVLQYHPKIFEIGVCFRNESDIESRTKSPEFTMLETYAVDKSLDYFVDIIIRIIHQLRSDVKFETVSVADIIKDDLCVDLNVEPDEVLAEKIVKKTDLNIKTPLYALVNYYIERYIEPLSQDKFVFFTDYPLCTISSAKKRQGTRSIINRFELFGKGIEIANAYEDEDDIMDFIHRAKNVGLFGYEEEIITETISKGLLSAKTVGLGIGVERLSMAIFERENIQAYFPSKPFSFQHVRNL
ncbi:MAG: hypothetical protein CL609_22910 [Anaerolineaceae bacterium]|nr:hypothetical protein [Anaerolineaceae bacterium]